MTSDLATEVARQQRSWSLAASSVKASIERFRALTLLAVAAAAVLATLATQIGQLSIPGRVFAVTGGFLVAAVPVIRTYRLSTQRYHDWIRLRSVSEALKAQLYIYLARVTPYDRPDADQRLAGEVQKIVEAALDLAAHLSVEPGQSIPVPAVTDAVSYAKQRVDSQINQYYRPKAAQAKRRLGYAQAVQLLLALAGALLGALVAAGGVNWAAAWVGVIGTLTGILAAHVAAARYVENVSDYSATALQLDNLRRRWAIDRVQPQATASADETFVRACEAVISVQNEAWMAAPLDQPS